MAPVVDVFAPEVPGGTPGGATGGKVKYKSVTIDLSGSGGTLANGQFVDFTIRDHQGNSIGSTSGMVTGILGANTFVYIMLFPGTSSLLPDLSTQDDVVGITVGTSSAISWGEESCGIAVSRTITTGTPNTQLYDIRGTATTDRSFGAVATGATSIYESGQTTYDPRSFGVISTPGTVTTLRSTTDYGTALFTPADLGDGIRTATEIPNGSSEIDWSSGTQAIFIGINRYIGAGATTATQTADGITLTNGSFSFPVERVHLHLMGDY